MKPRIIIRWIFYLVVLAAVGYGTYLALQPTPIDVDLRAIEYGKLQVTVNEDGRTRIKERYVISAPLTGRLMRIRHKPGDEAQTEGIPLALIQPRDPELLNARELRQAEALVSARQVALEQAAPLLETAKVELEYARTEADRMTRLNESGAGAQTEYDAAQRNLRLRQEQFRRAEQSKRILEFELEQAKAALIRSRSEDDFSNFELYSPISGKVLRVLQESATVVSPGTPLIEVGDPTDLEVVVDVLSSDAVKIETNARVYLDRWGGDNTLVGKVRLVEPSAFTKISSLGVEEQRVNVIVDLVDPAKQRQALGDGFRVEARIVVWEGEQVIKVPTGALFRNQGEWAVFVAENDTARLRKVELGHQNDIEAEVLSGLQQGEQVILHPSDKIKDQTLIKSRN